LLIGGIAMIDFIVSGIPAFLVGAVAGAIIMFFVARKNPKWVEDTYQSQRALSMQGTEEIDKLRKQVAEMELVKLVESEVQKAVAKLKG
jgi:uncharacterized membrane protein YdjX (TVP38/TMEM64 family)